MAKSADIMKMMNKLVKVSEVGEVMQQMQQEMCKVCVSTGCKDAALHAFCLLADSLRHLRYRPQAGVIEEMVDDAFEVLDHEDDEDAADEEVERVMTELSAETMSSARSAPTQQPVTAQQEEVADDDDEEDMAAMRDRLAQLKG